MSGLSFPVGVRTLGDFLPHRGPAVWIDEVAWVNAEEGECRVYFRSGANYTDASGRIRESSFVEWIAQAYGFVVACQVLSGAVPDEKRPEKTFLVQIRDLELHKCLGGLLPSEGEGFVVRVKRTHRLGPVALVEGKVMSSENVCLAAVKLKLFSR